MAERSRGRPRSFDPDAALGAAQERFRSGGYAGTSLDALAEATRLNRPSLYAAFGDKRALYLATLARAHERAERSFAGLVAAGLPLRDGLTRLFGYAIDLYLTGEAAPGGCIAIGTASAEATGDPAVRAALLRFVAMEDRQVEALLATAGVAGAHGRARVVTAAIHSLSTRARAGETREELWELAQATIDLVAPANG